MSDTKTDIKIEKKIVPKKTADKHAHFERKNFAVGDEVFLTANVESMAPGTLGKVAEIQFDGAVFVVKILTGPRHGETFRIKASDLKLKPIPKAEMAEKEGGA